MENTTEVQVRVDVDLLRGQRDAVLGDIEHNMTLAGQDGTAEHLEALEGLVNMLDHMLDLAENVLPDVYEKPVLKATSGCDYAFDTNQRSCWVGVKNISVYIQSTDEGVAVDLWPLECEDMDGSPAGTWYTFSEAQEEINCRQAQDIGA
jgi:hypothetical protein